MRFLANVLFQFAADELGDFIWLGASPDFNGQVPINAQTGQVEQKLISLGRRKPFNDLELNFVAALFPSRSFDLLRVDQ